MSIIEIVKLVLSLAVFLSRFVERAKVEEAFANALLVAVSKRADAAVAARDAVLAGKLPDVGSDANNRDNRG